MAPVISYMSAQRHALFGVGPPDPVFSAPQNTAEQLPHKKPPHTTNPEASRTTPQYLALTNETLRYHEALYQTRYHEQIPAVPAYHNRSRLDNFNDDTQSSHSTLYTQMTPMERFEVTATSNLLHNLYQEYHGFNLPYRETTRPFVTATTKVTQSTPPYLCVSSSLLTEVGSADDHRLVENGRGHLNSPCIRVYGLHYSEANYVLTDIGAQFECDSPRDGGAK